jgi:hypothetical protein
MKSYKNFQKIFFCNSKQFDITHRDTGDCRLATRCLTRTTREPDLVGFLTGLRRQRLVRAFSARNARSVGGTHERGRALAASFKTAKLQNKNGKIKK